MDLDEIQSVQSRERQTDSLQQLRDSFYEEAGEFVRALREERERVAERADDPFDAPEVNRLSDDIATAEQTLEAIYERRVGKIVKMASLAAADMPTEDDGLTAEERDLFDSLVGAIEDNREHVFDVLEGETTGPGVDTGRSDADETNRPPADTDEVSQPVEGSENDRRSIPREEQDPEVVSAAALMAEDGNSSAGGSTTDSSPDGDDQSEVAPGKEPPEAAAGGEARRDGGTLSAETSSDADGPGGSVGSDAGMSARRTRPIERTTVRITDDVGEILGIDDRAYDLTTNDVVTLPETNAEPLVERGAAERLD